jgi:hypothetical protein
MSYLRFCLLLLVLASSACAETTLTPASAATPATAADDVTKNACDQDKFWERDGDYYESCHDGSTAAQLPAEEPRKAKAEAKATASTSSSPCGKMCRESSGSRALTQRREQRITAPAGRPRI